MDTADDFQIFVKPAGFRCNLACRYCYYRHPVDTHPAGESVYMPPDLLEPYMVQHIEASSSSVIRFSWHGGEPTLPGVAYYRQVVAWQRKHLPAGRQILNGIQTNGTLLDDEWARFLAGEGFHVGLSLDGPSAVHDAFRRTMDDRPTHDAVMRGWELLDRYRVPTEILCVIHARNVRTPLEVYRFFKRTGAGFLTFLPLVERVPGTEDQVTSRSVTGEEWGRFLVTIFDEWVRRDIGKVKVQIFEEATRTAFHQEHSLCLFRPVCGCIPVVEQNGDFFCCDHYVDRGHRVGNLRQSKLRELLRHPVQQAFAKKKFDSLPDYCRQCEVLEMCYGECPRNRFRYTPDGEAGWNYLCPGYRQFFLHCRPFVAEVAAEWRRQSGERASGDGSPLSGKDVLSQVISSLSPGRNDPCPCGSGRKFKKCCLKKD